MHLTFRIALIGVGILVATAISGGAWLVSKRDARLSKVYATPSKGDLPVPFPLRPEEIEALRRERGQELSSAEIDAVALERAISRAEHLLSSRYACFDCHGGDLGGGKMVDDPLIGTLMGPNITLGRGSVVTDYTPFDWERIIRRGVKKDGTAAAMPSIDFAMMSDQEVSDIIAYIQSRPAVDREMPPVSFGPVGTLLVATGGFRLAAEAYADRSNHPKYPPDPSNTLAFGKHVAQPCVGCHGADFSGGPIAGGNPSWPEASNLTPSTEGLSGWSYEQFARALVESQGRDGTPLREPMTHIQPYAKNMSDAEMRSLYAYLQSLPPKPSGS